MGRLARRCFLLQRTAQMAVGYIGYNVRQNAYGALALGVRACFTSNFGFLPSSDIR